MQKKALQAIAQDIVDVLELDFVTRQGAQIPASVSIVDLLIQQLAEKVVALLIEASTGGGLSDEGVEARLRKARRKLKETYFNDQDDDEDETTGTGFRFPNLKYAKPKYKDMESVLKYVEQDEDKGGVKLVIMNFND